MPPIIATGPLIKSIRLIYIFGIFIGLSPYTINQKGQIYINSRSILQVVLPLIFNMLILWLTYCVDCGNALGTTGLLKIVLDIRDYFWNFMIVIVMILELFNKNKFVTIIQDLQRYDDLRKTSRQVNYKILIIKGYLFIVFNIVVIICGDAAVLERNTWQAYVVCYTSYFTPCFVMPYMLLKICFVNYLLMERFNDINDYLELSRESKRKVSVVTLPIN